MVTTIEIAAAEALGCDTEEISKESYDYYELDVYTYRDEEYAIGTEEEANKAVSEYIKESLWTFRPEVLAIHTKAGTSNGMIRAIEALQKDCESCNDDLKTLIEDLDKFAEDVVSEDGRGCFLSSYDGEEKEVDVNGIVFYCYRIN